MISAMTIETIKQKYDVMQDELDERSCRIWAATEANALGHGGVAAVARATRLARSTIWRGQKAIALRKSNPPVLR